MTRALALAALLILSACAPQRATPAPSGYSAVNGGADAYLHMAPPGTTNFPYGRQ